MLADLCGEDLDLWSSSAPSGSAQVFTSLGQGLRRSSVDRLTGDVVIEQRASSVLTEPQELAREVLGSVAGLAWWGDRPWLGALARHGDVFLPAARELLEARGSRWWADDLVRAEQVILGPIDEPPDLAMLHDEQDVLATSPWRVPQALTTSRRLGERLPAVRLCSGEAVFRWSRGTRSVGCWAVEVNPSAHVYELHCAEDWAELCVRYPHHGSTSADYRRWGVDAATSVAPDWNEVRRDWDGLHISMMGLLTAAGVPAEVDGAGAVLEDTDSEFTTWFQPCFGEPELIATVAPEDLP